MKGSGKFQVSRRSSAKSRSATFSLSLTLLACSYLSAGSSTSFAQIVLPSSGYINSVVGTSSGGYNGDGIAATSAEILHPFGVAVDSSGNIYIADEGNNLIRMVSASTGDISTIAGTGTSGFSGDGGAATSAELANPWGIALDSSGNVYFSDFNNNRIREITVSTGVITTIAGGGTGCASEANSVGDGCPATEAYVAEPAGVKVDSSGNVYFADSSDVRIREVIASTGTITTVAGNGTAGFSGDGGAATSAQLSYPNGLAFDSSGNMYIGDGNNTRIREVSASTGNINTVAGGGSYPFCSGATDSIGDGCAATSAKIGWAMDIVFDASGNMYFADSGYSVVREVVASTGVISLFAGSVQNGPLCGGSTDSVGDGCPATSGAFLSSPYGVALDSSGNLYIADMGDNRIRAVGH